MVHSGDFIMANPNGKPKTYKIPNPYNYKYSRQKAQAKFRKEEWAFTYETWYDLWVKSGKIEHMGSKPHQYCMVRLDEIEAWGPHNCIIITRRQHLKKQAYVQFCGYPNLPWEEKHGV